MPIDLEPFPSEEEDIIFVIEGDEVIRSALHFILDDQNETHSFAGLDLALAKAAELKARDSAPCLVLLGVDLLKHNGERVVAEITRQLPGASILIVANSVNDPLALTALEWGAHDVLGKPISFDSVQRRVDALLRRHKTSPGHAWAAPSLGGVVTGARQVMPATQRQVKQMDQAPASGLPAIEEIVENFSLLDEWDDRYRYVIELGRSMSPLPEIHRTDANKVQGCASQVWLATTAQFDREQPVLNFCGDSDAHIVRGLVAILLSVVSGKEASEILATDPIALFDRLGLGEHLTPQRSNGFRSMVGRIRADAQQALAAKAAAAE